MIASASSGTTSHTTCSIISRESLAIASYSGPRAASAAIFWSTADATTAAIPGDVPAGAGAEEKSAGGTGVGNLRATGEAADGAGGGEKRGTTGRGPVGTAGAGAEGTGPLGGNGKAGAEGVSAMGEEGAVATGMDIEERDGAAGTEAGIARGGNGAGGMDAVGTGGLPAATGGLTDGNPIVVRPIGGRADPGTEGCGVAPVGTAGIATDGRAPGISDGRGAGTGPGVGAAAGIGRAPLGRVGGLALHADAAGAGAGPRSMVISP